MTYYSAPVRVGETKLENLEHEVGCTEEEISIAKRHGMAAWHLEGLRLYCWTYNQLLILRSSKFASRQFHFSSEHEPKPSDVKGKTKNGEVIANSRIYPRHTRFFSDYDILSLWQRCGTDYSRVATCHPELNFKPIREVLDQLDFHIGNRPMFQHGANDEFVDSNGKAKNALKTIETFIAFDENRGIVELNNVMELKEFYEKCHLQPWVY